MPLYKINISEDNWNMVHAYLMDELRKAHARLHHRRNRYDQIDLMLSGSRPPKDYPFKNSSNVTTPLTQTRFTKLVNSTYEAIFGSSPVARFTPVTGEDDRTEMDWRKTAKEAQDWFDWAARRRYVLDVRETTRSALEDYFRYGITGIKVVAHRHQVKSGTIKSVDGEKQEWVADEGAKTLYNGPRWFYVSARDLIWAEGYGGDPQKIPYIGQLVLANLSMLNLRGSQRIYDPEAVKKVVSYEWGKERGDRTEEGADPEFGIYDEEGTPYITEVWFRFDVDGDGIEEELVADVHLPTETILRLTYRPFNFRPFFIARLKNRGGQYFDGEGVPDILKPVQDQVDALHNLALDSGRAALRHLVLLRTGSKIETVVIEKNQEIEPGFTTSTENPAADVVIHPLGDPRPALMALQLIEYLRQDARELVGIGPAQLGDVSNLQRAPSYGVQSVMAEGATFTRDASRRFAEPFEEAILATFEIMRAMKAPMVYIEQVLGNDAEFVQDLLRLSSDLRTTWAITTRIADPDATPEATMQREMVIGQFVMSWLREVGQAFQLIANPEVPKGIQIAMSEIARVSEEIVERVVENARSMQDVSSILLQVERLAPVAMQLSDQQAQQQAQAQMQAMAAGLFNEPGPTRRGGQAGGQS